MAQTTNFAENKSLEKLNSQLRCTAAFFGEVKHELIFLLVVNISVSITAFLGNTLILIALKKESSLHPPSKLLYRNLAITDLCVGMIAEPVYVAYFMSVLSDKWDICFYANLLGFFTGVLFSAVSLFTLAVIINNRLPRRRCFLQSILQKPQLFCYIFAFCYQMYHLLFSCKISITKLA